MIYPVITLYQPWATWIMRGWKTIETRTHNRFASLAGRTILIHAGKTTDPSAIKCPYLTHEQLIYNPDEVINGYILGSAHVASVGELSFFHSKDALIDCDLTIRFGLFLTNIEKFDKPIMAKGEMGIWYFDTSTNQKVKR